MENNYRFKIDYKKWKADLDALLAQRELRRAELEKKYWATLDYIFNDKLTKLYSIRAQARGRLHRQFARLNWDKWRELPSAEIRKVNYAEFNQNNGAIKFSLTLEDQAAYIGNAWKEYENKIE